MYFSEAVAAKRVIHPAHLVYFKSVQLVVESSKLLILASIQTIVHQAFRERANMFRQRLSNSIYHS